MPNYRVRGAIVSADEKSPSEFSRWEKEIEADNSSAAMDAASTAVQSTLTDGSTAVPRDVVAI